MLWTGKLPYKVLLLQHETNVELAKLLGKENEVTELPGLVKRMTEAAGRNLFNKQNGLFISGADKQVSNASQAWSY